LVEEGVEGEWVKMIRVGDVLKRFFGITTKRGTLEKVRFYSGGRRVMFYKRKRKW